MNEQYSYQRVGDVEHGHYAPSLRDQMAMAALNGILSMGAGKTEGPEAIPVVAGIAYQLADAMLAERIKPT